MKVLVPVVKRCRSTWGQFNDWRKMPVVFTRQLVLIVSLVVGLLSGGALLLATRTAERQTADAQRIDERERERIEDQILTRSQLENLARRIAKQETPSADQLARLVLRGLRAARKNPAIAAKIQRELRRVIPPDGSTTPQPERTTDPASRERPSGGGNGTNAPVPQSDPTPPPSGNPNPPTPTPPIPPGPEPPSVNVQTPDLPPPVPPVKVCVGALIGVNCDD